MLLHVSIVPLIICLCNCSTCVVLTIIYGFCKLLILPISKGMVLEMYKINPYMSRSLIQLNTSKYFNSVYFFTVNTGSLLIGSSLGGAGGGSEGRYELCYQAVL